MATWLEVRRPAGSRTVVLDAGRVTVGSDPGNDVVLDDPLVSRLHAVLEPVGPTWAVEDLGSRNGTLVNGLPLGGRKALHRGDDLLVGGTTIVFRSTEATAAQTVAAAPAPIVTAREREVLLELCRPVIAGSILTEPASVRAVAAALGVSDSAVKKHLANLYDRFDLQLEHERRRGSLANEAIRRGVVRLADLQQDGGEDVR